MNTDDILDAIGESADIMDDFALGKVTDILNNLVQGQNLPIMLEPVINEVYSQVWDLLNQNWEIFFEKIAPVIDEIKVNLQAGDDLSDNEIDNIVSVYNESFGTLIEAISIIIANVFTKFAKDQGLHRHPYYIDEADVKVKIDTELKNAFDDVVAAAVGRINEKLQDINFGTEDDH